MADIAAGLLWFRAKEIAGEVYESVLQMDIVDLWFLGWVGLSLFGMLIVHFVTSFRRRTPTTDASVQHSNQARSLSNASTSILSGGVGVSVGPESGENSTRRGSETEGTESCVWLNALVSWLTNGAANGSASILSLVSVWIVALNEAVRDTKNTTQQLVFERVLPGGSPPALSAVRVRSSNARSIVLAARVRAADTWLRVLCGRRFTEQAYNVKLIQLEGQVCIEMAQAEGQLSISVQFVSSPEIKLEVRLVGKADVGAGSQRKSSVPPQIEQSWLETRIARAIQECVLKLNLNTAIAPTRAPNGASQATAPATSQGSATGSSRSHSRAKEQPTESQPEQEIITKTVRPQAQAAPRVVTGDASVPAQQSPPSVTLTAPSSALAVEDRFKASLPPSPASSSPRTAADDVIDTRTHTPEEATKVVNGGTFAHAAPLIDETPKKRTGKTTERRLLKVIKASGLGAHDFGCRSAHCVVTVDYPPQRHQTPSVRGTVNPFWDSQFFIDLDAQSNQIMLEVFDDDGANGNDGRFLGQALVNLGLTRDMQNSRQILPLRKRPATPGPDNATGTVTIELLSLDNADFEALPITAQAHEYTLPKPASELPASITNGGLVNGKTPRSPPPPPPPPSPPPAPLLLQEAAPRRIIVETSRHETPRGDIVTTSHTMEEKAAEDEPPPVPQRSSSLFDPKIQRSAKLQQSAIAPLPSVPVASAAGSDSTTLQAASAMPRLNTAELPSTSTLTCESQSDSDSEAALESETQTEMIRQLIAATAAAIASSREDQEQQITDEEEETDQISIKSVAESVVSASHSEATVLDDETMGQLDMENPRSMSESSVRRANPFFSFSAPTLIDGQEDEDEEDEDEDESENENDGDDEDEDMDGDADTGTLTPAASALLASLLDTNNDAPGGADGTSMDERRELDDNENIVNDSDAFVHLTSEVSIVEIADVVDEPATAEPVNARPPAAPPVFNFEIEEIGDDDDDEFERKPEQKQEQSNDKSKSKKEDAGKDKAKTKSKKKKDKKKRGGSKRRKRNSDGEKTPPNAERVGDHVYDIIASVPVTTSWADRTLGKRLTGLLKRSTSGSTIDYRTRTLPANAESTLSPADLRASSPKRSRPLSSLFKRKSGGGTASGSATIDKEKEKDKDRKDRGENGSSKKSTSSGKKSKDNQRSNNRSITKDLEQATLSGVDAENGSLKRSKSSGLGGSFRKLFGSSVSGSSASNRDKAKRNASGASGNTFDSPT